MKNKEKLSKLESIIVGATFIAVSPFVGLALAIREVVKHNKKSDSDIIDEVDVIDE